MQRAVRVWLSAGVLLLCGVPQASAQTKVIDPYSLPMVQAACGGESESAPQGSVGSHGAEPALKPGLARVYVITETRGLFGKLGEPVRLGIDGHWFGVNHETVYGYSYVDVMPGVHHLCAAAKVRGALPHTNNAVLLERVEAVAGQSYSFYNQYIRLAGFFTLQPINPEEGAMYAQALPAGGMAGMPKLWKTAEARLTCGADPNQMPSGSVPPPTLPGPPEAGKALVYFFSGVPQFDSHNVLGFLLPGSKYGYAAVPIHVGIDRRWIGETQQQSYVAVSMAPGAHRLCSATKLVPGMRPTLHLGQLDVVAGQTYFVDTNTLLAVKQGVATEWLQRIAAMPQSDAPDMRYLKRWNRTNFPASEAELRACGIPPAGSALPAPKVTPAMSEAVPAGRVFFLLKSDMKRLPRANAVNVGLDSRWTASLRSTSWLSIPVAKGQHDVCIHVWQGSRQRDQWFSVDTTLFLDDFNVRETEPVYFESVIVVGGDAGDFFLNARLEGVMDFAPG